MTTYNSYEAALDANPEKTIYKIGDNFTESSELLGQPLQPCNPDDHCMSMLTFSELGHKLVDGDLYQNEDGRVFTVGRLGYDAKYCNLLSSYCFPSKIYILRAAALENQMNIDKVETQTEHQEEMSAFSGEFEWNNGDECRYSNDIDHLYIYIGEHPHGDGHYAFSEDKGITYIANGYLLEPETPQQREDRERLESAYDLYCNAQHAVDVIGYDSFEKFNIDKVQVKFWLAIVDKANYRKEV